MPDIALITGSMPFNLKTKRRVKYDTPYGPSEISLCRMGGKEIAHLRRHGKGIPPHKISHRANIYALKKLGVKKIFATASSGIINRKIKPGDIVIPHDFIDLNPAPSFYDAEICHVSMDEPFCPYLREVVISSAEKLGISYVDRAVYVRTPGPRFETASEIRFYKRMGADIVGMTMAPEAVLAREAGICYAPIATADNFAAGIKGPVNMDMVRHGINKSKGPLTKLIYAVIKNVEEGRCRH